jgi:hypothetical protein
MGRYDLTRRRVQAVLPVLLRSGGGRLPRHDYCATGRRAKSASRIAASLLPKPYAAPFVVPPIAQPKGTTEGLDGVGDVPLYNIVQKEGLAQILPTITTPIFGYDGIAPGPTILARKRPGRSRVALLRRSAR